MVFAMQDKINMIINELEKIPGLYNFAILGETHKKTVLEIKDSRNTGVLRCLGKQFVMVMTHDSKFRQPDNSLVLQTSEGIVFPALPFPEINAKKPISASPSKKVHDYLIKTFDMNITEEHATLLVGFDLL